MGSTGSVVASKPPWGFDMFLGCVEGIDISWGCVEILPLMKTRASYFFAAVMFGGLPLLLMAEPPVLPEDAAQVTSEDVKRLQDDFE